MLKPLVLLFSVLSCVLVLHFSLSSSSNSNDALSKSAIFRMDVDPLEDLSEEIQRVMTTLVPTQLARNAQLSAGFLRDYYAKQAETRSSLLRGIRGSNFATLYNVLVPEVYCPDLVRVGNINDGGKWVCKPQAMPKENCSIYSLGLRDDISFDSEIQEFNNFQCKIYGYDAAAQKPATVQAYSKMNGEAKTMKITPTTNLSKSESSIEDLLRSHGDSYTEILKMDIEGAEYSTLPKFLDTFKACQIYLEMHGEPGRMRDLLIQIAKRDYYLFFYEVNGDSLKACEYSFIHTDCMDRYGTFMLAPYLKNAGPFVPPPAPSPQVPSPSSNQSAEASNLPSPTSQINRQFVFPGRRLNGPVVPVG